MTFYAGTYRGEIRPGVSGQEGAPIVFRAHRSGDTIDKVVISGFDPIVENADGNGSWQLHAPGIYKLQMGPTFGLGVGQNMLSSGMTPLIEARWPDAARTVDFNRYTMMRATAGGLEDDGSAAASGRFNAWYEAQDLAEFASGAWAGGYIQLVAEQGWWNKSGVVTANAGNRIDFEFDVSDTGRETPSEGDPFYLAGRLAALTTENEFFFDETGLDGPAKTLFVHVGETGPSALENLEIKTRNAGAWVDDREYIRFEDLTFFGARIKASPDSSHIEVVRCTVLYGAYDAFLDDGNARAAIQMRGPNGKVIDSTVRHAMANGITAQDPGTEIRNNVVEKTWIHGINTDNGSDVWVTDNTVFDTGTTVLSISAAASRILRNHVFRGGWHITDIDIMNTYNSGDALGTEVAYNWVHDNRAEYDPDRRWNGGGGIRLDGGGAEKGCSNYLIHHNVVWNAGVRGISTWALNEGQLNKGDAKIYIYNNSTDNTVGIRANEDARGIEMVNNLAFAGLYYGNAAHQTDAFSSNNLKAGIGNTESALFNDFRLPATSSAVDAGLAIPGVTTDTQGAAPDIGAYEYGGDYWVPGARILDHQIHALTYSHQRLDNGSHVIVVTGLEPGRTLPDTAAVRLNGESILTGFHRVWDFPNNQFTAFWVIDPSVFPTTVSIEHTLDGTTFLPTAQGTLTFTPSALIGPDFQKYTAGDTVEVTGQQLFGYHGYRTPLIFENYQAVDLTERPVALRFDSASLIADGKMREDGSDLHFILGKTGELLEYHIESGFNSPDTLIWLRKPAGTPSYLSTEDAAIYMAYGTDPPQNLHVSFEDMFPFIPTRDITLWLRSNSISNLSNSGPVSAWENTTNEVFQATQTNPDHQPEFRANGPNEPPSLAFDGSDFLFVGDLPDSAFHSFGVYRNPEPGSQTWQRLYSARSSDLAQETDWQQGLAHVADNDGSGIMTPYNEPNLHVYAASDVRHLSNMVIGGTSNLENPPMSYFTGEIYELLLFNRRLPFEIHSRIENEYFAPKYSIDSLNGYLAHADFAATIQPIELRINGETIPYRSSQTDGIAFEFPDLGPNATEFLIELILPDGTVLKPPAPSFYFKEPYDAWRIDRFAYLPNGPLSDPSAREADPDSDGLSNLMEYALDLDPVTASTTPTTLQLTGAAQLELSFNRARSELVYTVEASDDLSTWTPIATNPGNLGETVTVTDSVTAGPSHPSRFLRLRVEQP